MIPSLLLALVASAQPAAQVLTLDEALQQAQTQNLDLVIARERLTQAKEASRKAWSGYLPQVTAGGSYSFNSTDATLQMPVGSLIRDTGVPQGPAFDPSRPPGIDNPPGAQTTFISVPESVVELEVQKKHQFGGQVQLQQALVAPALWPAIRQAYLSEDLAELSTENARREILFAVVQLYYGAEALRQAVEVQERLLEVNRAHEKDAEVKLSQGMVPRVAVLRAQIDRAQSEQNLVRTKNAYRSALSSLATVLDRPVDFEVTRPPVPPEPPAATADELQETALRERPDVLSARVGVDLAEAQKASVRNSYLPSLGLSATYQASNTAGFTGQNGFFMASLGLQWVLWDGGLRESNFREARSRLVESQAQARLAENRARDEVRRAQLDLESAEANRIKAEEQARLAIENSELVQKSFEAGVATYLEVTDAQLARRSAELSRVSEVLNAELARIQLARAAGFFNP